MSMPSDDVVQLIEADHREVERLFELLQKKRGQRSLFLPVVASLLVAHSRAEEAEVYPVARVEGGQSDDVAHSQEEHVEAENQLKQLLSLDPDGSDFEPALQELIDSVKHHVEEEESTVLPGMRRNLSKDRLQELADAFTRSRAEHLGDLPGDETRQDLLEQARNLGVESAASKRKDQLQQDIG
jgi:hypothetical protein